MGTGFNRGLLSDTVFEAHKIYKMNKSEVENDQELTEEEIEEIRTGDYYHKLATVRISQFFLLLIFFSRSLQKFLDIQTSRRRFCFCSLAAQIKIQVNKSINYFSPILPLFLDSGMKIRGNMNLILMGDPGVAKSQLLGFIDRLAPRCQVIIFP